MDPKFLSALGNVAGIGGVAIGALVFLIKDVLATRVFHSLPTEQALQIIWAIVIGAFALGALGIAAWIAANRRISRAAVPKVHAHHGSVAFGDGAKGNQVTVNHSGSAGPADARQK